MHRVLPAWNRVLSHLHCCGNCPRTMGSLLPTAPSSTAFSPHVLGTQLSCAWGFCDHDMLSSLLVFVSLSLFSAVELGCAGTWVSPWYPAPGFCSCRLSIRSGKCLASSSPVFLVARAPSSGSIGTHVLDLLVVFQHIRSRY